MFDRLALKVDSGVWYYELEVVTEGIMQVGTDVKDHQKCDLRS